MIKHLQTDKPANTLLLLTLAFILLAFNSCKKDSKETKVPDAPIMLTVDGKAKTFDQEAAAIALTYNGFKSTSLRGVSADGAIVSITVRDEVKLGIAYSNNSFEGNNQTFIQYITDGESYTNTYDYFNVSNHASVTFLSITDTHITGKFNGDLFQSTTGNKKKAITDGKFDIKLTTQILNDR